MWRHLGVSGKLDNTRHFFEHPLDSERKVFVFSDAPHLIKCVRNRILQQKFLKVNGKWVRWDHYVKLFETDCTNPEVFRVCPKLTASHIHLTNAGKMRVKYATQLFSNSVVHGLKFYKQRVSGLNDCDGTIIFTQVFNDVFDALNRRFKKEKVTLESSDFEVLRRTLAFLDNWERELRDGHIQKEMFLTPNTAEGLRVTLHSTIDLSTYLLTSCNFRYVLTAKMNQDPIERFFGTVRQAGCQNDHPSMPTFLQLYRLLSVYKLVRPPKSGNCQILKQPESSYFSMADFKAIFSTDEPSPTRIADLKARLDGLIESDTWECDDAFPVHDQSAAVTDCVLYFVAGFVARRFRRYVSCRVCKDAFVTQREDRPEAALTNIKSRGWLTYPNKHLYQILRVAEEFFSENASSMTVYEDTIDHVLTECSLTFPCVEHKDDMIANILHYYVSMRMRQYCGQSNAAATKASREKRKLAKHCTT